MRRGMEIEAELEKIWDLHDKISDAIHAVSRAHFVHTVNSLAKSDPHAVVEGADPAAGRKRGFVFAKGLRSETYDGAALAEEARSLDAIRSSLENLEDQLEFFHTLQCEQHVERTAALAQLEQSRIVLAMRLSDHRGKEYSVIEEALAFVGNVRDEVRFITPESLYEMLRSQCGDNLGGQERRSGIFIQMVVSGFALAKSSLRLENVGGVLGNAVIFATSMIAFRQLHQFTLKSSSKENIFISDISSRNSVMKPHLAVFSAKG